MCGYNEQQIALNKALEGSSPRVRVQHEKISKRRGKTRIIPACAGTTNYTMLDNLRLGDHPRVCGYNPTGIPTLLHSLGSSPRVRVHLTHSASVPLKSWDHPRVCGYNCLVTLHSAVGGGSSPRVRVQRKTIQLYLYQFWDHPRVCGYNVYNLL